MFNQIANAANNNGLLAAMSLMPSYWQAALVVATYGARVQFTCGTGRNFTLYADGKIVKGHE